MKKFLAALVFLISAQIVDAQNWTINKAIVTFTIKNAGINVSGSFSDFEGKIFFDAERPSDSKMFGKVAVKSIDTGIQMRNNHLLGKDYFDATKYPFITMTLSSLTQKNGVYFGVFILEIKGVKRTIEMPLTFAPKDASAVLSGAFKIDRLDFGVGESSFIMSDDVAVSIILNISRP